MELKETPFEGLYERSPRRCFVDVVVFVVPLVTRERAGRWPRNGWASEIPGRTCGNELLAPGFAFTCSATARADARYHLCEAGDSTQHQSPGDIVDRNAVDQVRVVPDPTDPGGNNRRRSRHYPFPPGQPPAIGGHRAESVWVGLNGRRIPGRRRHLEGFRLSTSTAVGPGAPMAWPRWVAPSPRGPGWYAEELKSRVLVCLLGGLVRATSRRVV